MEEGVGVGVGDGRLVKWGEDVHEVSWSGEEVG